MDLAAYRNANGLTVADLRRKLEAGGVVVSHEAVRRWLTDLPVSPKHMAAIEAATGGHVTRYDLRPDIFGPAPRKRRAA